MYTICFESKSKSINGKRRHTAKIRKRSAGVRQTDDTGCSRVAVYVYCNDGR
jgi:hypothetical protein